MSKLIGQPYINCDVCYEQAKPLSEVTKYDIENTVVCFDCMSKAKGTAFERYTMAKLEAKGFYCMRSAASKGQADIIAIPYTNFRKYVYLVQCKAHKQFSLTGKDILALEKFAVDSPLRHVVKCVVMVKRPRSIKQYVFHQGRWRRIQII